jgi:hypothetical protein
MGFPIVRASLALFCCGALAAIAYAGANSNNASSKAPPASANHDRDLYHVPIPDLRIQHHSISEFRAISDRPLFSSSRRPTPAAATAQVQVHRLRGVLTTDSLKIALVESIDDGTLLRLSEGDIVDVWQVYAIRKDSITWSRLDRSDEMIVAEVWEEGGVLSSTDSFQLEGSEANEPNEQTNASSQLNRPRGHIAGERAIPHRHLTRAAEYAPIVVPTEPPPPTPTAPRNPPMRRISNPKGPA